MEPATPPVAGTPLMGTPIAATPLGGLQQPFPRPTAPSLPVPGSGPFDLWGASEWINLAALLIGLAALLVTTVGVVLALRALVQAKDFADSAARDTRRILENELGAVLNVPPVRASDDDYYGNQPSDGLWVSVNEYSPGLAWIHGRLRNIGRYLARDVDLSVWQDGAELQVVNRPHDVLYPDPHAEEFDFALPLVAVVNGIAKETFEAEFPVETPIRVRVVYADGNGEGHIFEQCYVFEGNLPWVNWVSRRVDCPIV